MSLHSKLKKIAKLFNHVIILELNSNRNHFTQHGWHMSGFGKGLLAKQIASLIYELSGKTTEEPISLKLNMGLNDNSTTHIANKEIVIPTAIVLDHPKTQPDKVTCRISTRTKRPPVTRQYDFLW
jgi:hypothetical protein